MRHEIAGGWYSDALPGGAYVCAVKDSHLETDRGTLSLPEGQNLLYVRLSHDGRRFAGVGHRDDQCWQWDETAWTQHGLCWGPDSVIYDAADELYILHGPPPSGLRYVARDGRIVTEDETRADPVRGLWDWTELDGFQVGQGSPDACIVRFDDDGVRRLIEPGDIRSVRAHYDGGTVAIAMWRLGTPSTAIFHWLTVAELHALPVYVPAVEPPPPPEVPHVDRFDHPMWVGPFGNEKDPSLPGTLSIPGTPAETAKATRPVMISRAHLGREVTPIVAIYCEAGTREELQAQVDELRALRPGLDIAANCEGEQGAIIGKGIIAVVEGYSNKTLCESPASIAARVRAVMDRLPADQRIMLVPQAFDHRDGPEPYTIDPVGICKEMIAIARDPRVVAFAPFVADRADTRVPEIVPWLRALLAAVPGTPAITVPPIEPPPVVPPEPPPVVVVPPTAIPRPPVTTATERPRGGLWWALIRALASAFGKHVR